MSHSEKDITILCFLYRICFFFNSFIEDLNLTNSRESFYIFFTYSPFIIFQFNSLAILIHLLIISFIVENIISKCQDLTSIGSELTRATIPMSSKNLLNVDTAIPKPLILSFKWINNGEKSGSTLIPSKKNGTIIKTSSKIKRKPTKMTSANSNSKLRPKIKKNKHRLKSPKPKFWKSSMLKSKKSVTSFMTPSLLTTTKTTT